MISPNLRDLIARHFNLTEQRQLCFDLAIPHEEIPGDTPSIKAQSLVEYCLRHNRLPDLGQRGRELRPEVAWPDVAALAESWQNNQTSQKYLQDNFSGDQLTGMLAPLRQKETGLLTQLLGSMNVSGDAVGGDKVAGDKIAGNKVIQNIVQI